MKNFYYLFILVVVSSCSQKKQALTNPNTQKDYDKAWHYLEHKNQDSAFFYFSKVTSSNTDSTLTAKSFANMAIIQCDNGDYFGSVETATSALKFYNKKKDSSNIAAAYNSIAIAKYKLRDYSDAIKWYNSSLELSEKDLKPVIEMNLAVSAMEQKNYNQAIPIYTKIFHNKSIKDSTLYARLIDNLTWTKWLQNPTYNAVPVFLQALNIREKVKDSWGQNVSHAHLADYYSKVKPDSALWHASIMYRIAKQIKSPDDQLEALQKLIRLSPPQETKRYFQIYQKLGDSVQAARNAAKNQFALIRYETEKNKADNLKLQKDNTEKRYQINLQKILFGVVGLAIIVAAVILVFWYKKRKQRLELEAQTAIRENQLKTSKKVHDVVANGLYRMMTEIENGEEIDKNRVLDKIEDLYEKSRDISYDDVKFTDQNFQEKISELITSFATKTTKVTLAGNDLQLWEKVNAQVKLEIEHILTELMVNMKKHSGATNVAVKFEQKQDQINIYYTDNGIGMPEEMRFNNGLRNTGTRIETIRGEITFDTKVEKGLKIHISFPIT